MSLSHLHFAGIFVIVTCLGSTQQVLLGSSSGLLVIVTSVVVMNVTFTILIFIVGTFVIITFVIAMSVIPNLHRREYFGMKRQEPVQGGGSGFLRSDNDEIRQSSATLFPGPDFPASEKIRGE